MKQRGAFDLDPFDVVLSSRTARVNIDLFLMPTGSVSGESRPYPISGFPRTLVTKASSGCKNSKIIYMSLKLIGLGVPSSPTNGSNVSQKTTNTRRRARRMRKSTDCVPSRSHQVPRPQASRSFSLPERSRIDLADESSGVTRSEPLGIALNLIHLQRNRN